MKQGPRACPLPCRRACLSSFLPAAMLRPDGCRPRCPPPSTVVLQCRLSRSTATSSTCRSEKWTASSPADACLLLHPRQPPPGATWACPCTITRCQHDSQAAPFDSLLRCSGAACCRSGLRSLSFASRQSYPLVPLPAVYLLPACTPLLCTPAAHAAHVACMQGLGLSRPLHSAAAMSQFRLTV